MNSSDSVLNGKGIRFSSLGSEVLLAELYCKLNTFPDPEKTKVVTSWLANSYADLTNTGSGSSELLSCYIVHVRLFNTLANNSSFDKACQLAECFLRDFLSPFVFPALTETGGNFSEATYYLQIACENITQPLLLRKIIGLIISKLLPTLLSRLRSEEPKVLVATLGLFKVLLEFYCEDLWYELILQYLLPMKHLMVSERQKSLPDISYTESTIKFLDLIPECISKTLDPEVLAEHFVLYIQQELNRLKDIDLALTKGVPLSKYEITGIPLIDDFDDSQNSSDGMDSDERNSTFPLWAFKYDGTDVLHASRKFSFGEPEEYFEDDLFKYAPGLFSEHSMGMTSTMKSTDDPQTQNYQVGHGLAFSDTDHDDPITSAPTDNPPALSTLEPQVQNSRRYSDDVSHAAYLGPFLDALYKLLGEWTRVEPEVIVMVSEIFSVMASSRIPLISTLILDLAIILQPYYPSFSAIVYTIRAKLDGSMQKCPPWFIKNTWQKSSSGTMLKSEDSVQPGSSLRDKFLKSHPFSFVSNLSKGSSLIKLFTNGSSFSENRILTRSASGFETEDEEILAKKMTLRCILFSHWLLELAAIAQQTCWSQSRR